MECTANVHCQHRGRTNLQFLIPPQLLINQFNAKSQNKNKDINKSLIKQYAHCVKFKIHLWSDLVLVSCLFFHSCSLNIYTKVLMNGNSSTSQVSVQIFSFVDLNVIYLHCQVQICAQIGSNSCVPVSTSPPVLPESAAGQLKKRLTPSLRSSLFSFQDCLQRIARASPNTIGTALGSFGPLLKSDEGGLCVKRLLFQLHVSDALNSELKL